MTVKRWRVSAADEKTVEKLEASLGLHSLASRVLSSRGCASGELAREFIEGDIALESPLKLQDMEKAASRINEALERDETIAVFGDYDVDGLSSSALLLSYLQSRGAEVLCALPSREGGGYGLSKDAVRGFQRRGASLLITVDNGVSAHEEIALANSLGMQVIVSDHHKPAETLPEAYAVIDPLRSDDESEFKGLAGVGVALKLISAVEGCETEELLEEYGWLAAIGTVADLMPLTGENRLIVKRGLLALKYCDCPGLRFLAEEAGAPLESATAQSVAFSLAPRLNAAGRMEGAETALSLLISDNIEEAEALAKHLEALNAARREAEAEVITKIEALLAASPEELRRPIIVLAAENLHSGVTGIACSRLVERFGKPVIIISIEGETAKGSGRATGGLSLHSAIASASSLLKKYGGHDMAAGFMLNTADIAAFKQRLWDYCRTCEELPALLSIDIDSEIALSEISEEAIDELELLAPFGRGFEEPVFAARSLTVGSISPLNERHCRISLTDGKNVLTGAWFSHKVAELPFKRGDSVDAVFSLSVYEGASRRSVSVRFLDIAPQRPEAEVCESLEAYRALAAERELDEAQKSLLTLTRANVAQVYRTLKSEALDRENLPRLASLFGDLGLGKALCALDVLQELGLVRISPDEEGRFIALASENAQKRELSESELFNRLSVELKTAGA